MQSEIVTRLDAWLSQNRPAVYESLQLGVNDETLTKMEAELGFVLPLVFKDLYRWRNGQQGDESPAFRNNQYLMPVDEIRSTWRLLTDMQEHGEWEQPQWWSRGWVPFLHNGAGSHLCIDMPGSFTGNQGQVIEFWAKFPDRKIVAPELETWLSHFVASLEQGLWNEDKDGNFSLLDEDNLPVIPRFPIRCDSNDPLPH